MKKVYMKPATDVCSIKPTQMFMSSTLSIKSLYDEDNMTDLGRDEYDEFIEKDLVIDDPVDNLW